MGQSKSYTFNNTNAYSYYRWDISNNNGNVYLQSSEFTFSGPTITSVENRNDQQIRIFPNPTKTELYISGNLLKNTNYEIISMEGKSLQTGALSGGSISIKSLKAGFYLIKIETSAGQRLQRFVKE